jgi:glycosyltransferase involved in cell wall biosynthesis
MGADSGRAVVVRAGVQAQVVTGADIRNRAKVAALEEFSNVTVLRLDPWSNPQIERQVTAALDGVEEASTFVVDSVLARHVLAAIRSRFPKAVVVVDFHNIESDLHRQQRLARWPGLLRRFVAPAIKASCRGEERAEAAVAMSADRVWVCSHADKARLAAIAPGVEADVVPNPAPSSVAVRAKPDGGPSVLFVGHLGYRPNKRAARYLARKVLPLLRRERPAAGVVIAGHRPDARLLAQLGRTPGVECVASPDDLAPLYARATVTAMPLFEGGGTRIKALEAAAYRVPIVATALAVDGIGLEPGRHYLRAETARAFSSAIGRVIDDADLARSLADAAQAHVAMHFSQEAISRAIAASLDSARAGQLQT